VLLQAHNESAFLLHEFGTRLLCTGFHKYTLSPLLPLLLLSALDSTAY
jgi:hypothetical protein